MGVSEKILISIPPCAAVNHNSWQRLLIRAAGEAEIWPKVDGLIRIVAQLADFIGKVVWQRKTHSTAPW